MKLLLAEDDPLVGDGVAQGLRLAGFTVDWMRDGREALHALKVGSYSLLLLDLGLPLLDGLALLDKLRRQGNTIPVLVITARDALPDRIDGLNRGADDYLVKPFDLDELVARIHALLRRGQGRSHSELRLGTLCVSPLNHTVTLDGQDVPLTSREFALLAALMETPGAVISVRDIEERLYGWEEEVSNNAVEVLLHRLRKKLGGEWIRNVRGVGFKIVEPA
ncbi:response regulator [Thauera propionica]|uniref:response regulator n=1 Tax=Thauera propionica TaxID=2019431 RepID=UPI0023F43C24|nr:response regulator [Thauera propionica]MDD3676816.1 response regulator [Thauera propionica]